MVSHVRLTDLTSAKVEELVLKLGIPRFRADQLLRWTYQAYVLSYDEMVNIPVTLRQALEREAALHTLVPAGESTGEDGTVKTLFRLADRNTIEATLMPSGRTEDKRRNTVCVSTQVGCPVRCPFCATGRQGFKRNLTPGEIIDQTLFFARRLKGLGESQGITNLVFMGMGEPLANYRNLRQAIEMLNSPQGFGLGARSITVSTAGMVPQIKTLAREKLQVELAVSLHAAKDSLRNRLVPLNQKYPLGELIPACREYFDITGRRITFEYSLFEGINDSPLHARWLGELLSGITCHVNLIAANAAGNKEFRPPSREVVLSFERNVRELGITCTIRKGRGLGIDAGCGQLRSRLSPIKPENAG